MNDKFQAWIEKLKSITNLFTHKRTVKSARITYQVFWNLLLLLMTVIILGGAFAGGVGAGYFASLVKDEPVRSYDSMKKDIYNYTETSDLFFLTMSISESCVQISNGKKSKLTKYQNTW